MDLESTDIYFYDKLEKNIWNPRGNGWRLEHKDAIKIQCHNPESNPVYHCGCQTIKIAMTDTAAEVNILGKIFQTWVIKEPPLIIKATFSDSGIYHLDPESSRLGFLSPVYKKEDSSYYLYSHHPMGHLWLVGRSFTSW
jgi:hypothetical protein